MTLKEISNYLIAITSFLLIYKGVEVAYYTTGDFSGSKFGMLGIIANQIAYISLWFASIGLHLLLKKFKPKKSDWTTKPNC